MLSADDIIEKTMNIVLINANFPNKQDFEKAFESKTIYKEKCFKKTLPQTNIPIPKDALMQLLENAPFVTYENNKNLKISYLGPEKRITVSKDITQELIDENFEYISSLADKIIRMQPSDFAAVGINFIYLANENIDFNFLSNTKTELQNTIDSNIDCFNYNFVISENNYLKTITFTNVKTTKNIPNQGIFEEKDAIQISANYNFESFKTFEDATEKSEYIRNNIINNIISYYKDFNSILEKMMKSEEK